MTNTTSLHENLTKNDDVKVGSEKSFGLVFAVVFLVVAVLPLWNAGWAPDQIRIWALIVSGGFLVLALAAPRTLRPLNMVWFRFGLILHNIVNPLIMGLIFFLAVTPIGLIMRMRGKTPLDLGFDKRAESYWIHRTPPAPAPNTMPRQF